MISKFPPAWNFKLTWSLHKSTMISKFPPQWNFKLTWSLQQEYYDLRVRSWGQIWKFINDLCENSSKSFRIYEFQNSAVCSFRLMQFHASAVSNSFRILSHASFLNLSFRILSHASQNSESGMELQFLNLGVSTIRRLMSKFHPHGIFSLTGITTVCSFRILKFANPSFLFPNLIVSESVVQVSFRILVSESAV